VDLKRLCNHLLYFLILPYCCISFILCDLTNDNRIFIGTEAIADKFYPLPYGWDAAYEVKPIGNRILNWMIYKVANFFVPIVNNDYTHFGWVVKATMLIIMLACCWYVASKIKFPFAFLFLALSFICEANFSIGMAEWFTVLFSLIAVAWCMEDNKNWTFAAGALCIIIALLKSISGLMVVPIICAVYLFGKKIEWKRFIAGYAAAGLTFLALCATIWPYSIGDMLMSRLIAHVGMYGPKELMEWFWMTQAKSYLPSVMAYYIPAILVGMIAAIFVLFYYLGKKDKIPLVLFLGMWSIPIAIVFVQSEFIIYHYLVMMLPAIITIAILTTKNRRGWQFIIAGIVLIMISYVLINNALFGSFTAFEYSFWQQKEQNADAINAQYNLTNQSSLLYLDPGDAQYYFHANSSCHYIAPMPVERSTKKWNISYLPQFTETYDCIMDYRGKYIVGDITVGQVSGYYGEGILIRQPIMDKLNKEYTPVMDKSWTIYERKPGI
jgi:hypothetical protein